MSAAIWNMLHRKNFTNKSDMEKFYYFEWKKLIPQKNCPCKSHFDNIEVKHPPVFDSENSYRHWTWVVHNEVNKKLGKPQITLEEAASIHGWEIEMTKNTESKCLHLGPVIGRTGTRAKPKEVFRCEFFEAPCTLTKRKEHENLIYKEDGPPETLGMKSHVCQSCPEFSTGKEGI